MKKEKLDFQTIKLYRALLILSESEKSSQAVDNNCKFVEKCFGEITCWMLSARERALKVNSFRFIENKLITGQLGPYEEWKFIDIVCGECWQKE